MKQGGKNINWLIVVAGLFISSLAAAQSVANEKFGQNRVQYKDFTFQYYESDNFITYFYQGGQDVAKYVIKTAEDEADDISKLLDYRYRRKIDIIIYNNINELNQTNIGIYEPSQTPGGTVKIPDSKIFIYFNGDHANLSKQVREGIARVYIEKMVQGSGFAEVVQNAVLLNLPDWYKVGLIQYVGESWNSDMEDRLRDGILTGRYKKLNKLRPEEAIFVGHSIWHYIEEVHGKTVLANIIYLTRVNRSVDNGFLFVLGANLPQTLEQWYNYYYTRFTNEEKLTSMPDKSTVVKARTRKTMDYYQAKLSPDGKTIAYASNDMGRYKVHLLNTETRKHKVIMRGGFRTNTQFTDNSIPLLAWDPSGKKLAMIRDKRSNIFIHFYDVESRKKEVAPIRKFQKITSFSYIDSKQLVMSAVQNGQTDIYTYIIASTTTRKITDDYFDDLQPAYISADSIHGIMFASNREDGTLIQQRYESQVINKQFDLYFYDLDANPNNLYRITSTPYANETYPQNLNDTDFCFLSDKNGIRNRYIGHFERVFDHNLKTYRYIFKESGEVDSVQVAEYMPLDSAIDRTLVDFQDSSLQKVYKTGGVTSPYSNFTHSIREQSVVPDKNLSLDLVQQNNKVQFRKYTIDTYVTTGNIPEMDYMQKRSKASIEVASEPKKEETPVTKPAPVDSASANRGNRPYDFQSEYDFGIKLFDWDSASALRMNTPEEGYVFRFSRVRPYFVRFATDKVIALLDNNISINRYQVFNPVNPNFENNVIAMALQLGITDLLENHKIYGGVSFPVIGRNGRELGYFITYENLTRRLDKKFTFYRRAITSNTTNDALVPYSTIPNPEGFPLMYKAITNYAQVQLDYPLNVLQSFRFQFAFRNDNIIYKSFDTFSLRIPTLVYNWLSARTEYVFDNCIEGGTNIRYGFRFKVFAEIQKDFPTQNKVLFDRVDVPVPVFNKRFFTVLGFDARHYLKIYKQIIWANRVSGAASLGNARMIYYLGGYDNWITFGDKFDRNTPINMNHGYAFQTLATPLRGFNQNARNGDKYLLINSELRVPIFSALFNAPIKSELIRNFQLIGFFDIGSAWEGLSPFSNSNPLFNRDIYNTDPSVSPPSVIVKLRQYRNPIIMGFGPGIRTSIFGYFMRLDAAWGYDTGELSKSPKIYFSLGTDF